MLSFSTTSSGVFLGAPTPHQLHASQHGTKSPTGGTSGRASEPVVVVTASARNLPVLMYSITGNGAVNTTSTWPAIRSIIAGPAPRYGTCIMLMPAMVLNNSPAKWGWVPVPGDAMVILPGLASA